MTSLIDPMRQIVDLAAPQLKALGFRKRRHSFNRSVGDGITHVLNFQMGSSNPPGTVEIPGLRPNLQGRFTVNVGVHSPSMPRQRYRQLTWINEYNCQLRKRLGFLLPEQDDVWWHLDHPDAGVDAIRAVIDVGVPWLDRFQSSESIWSAFEAEGSESIGMSRAGALDIADLYSAHGHPEDARRVLNSYARKSHNSHHVDYLVKHLEDRGFHDLSALVQSSPPSS
ncbi:DUF4304 domain-containing protein [Herbiconiux sp. CPCC 203407]|uniref:DUF4304 domain-containing protein n=1 Tax=Herbiconiux oxytropis TaxID=2970915 RepID=A0AA41XCS7_9MICO|nr:DUF4304 domain-containing protein [Herbiconiux oxytropis]MCS5722889.1 DUF4304 domain-containing protein [Herbiconiux oxytropis]MCS5725851.1 DUF4304 domain-containing protein [Herbiconiux oxytropis]